MHTSNNKIHNYKVTLTIHEIHITVKFPCSVSVGLKSNNIDPKTNTNLSEFKLEKGSALANH